MRFEVPIDFNRNEIQNVVLQNLAGAPTTLKEGLIYYDSTTGVKRGFLWNGSNWLALNTTLADLGLTIDQNKISLIDADQILIKDSADNNSIKKILWSDVKTLIAAVPHTHSASNITTGVLPIVRGGTELGTAPSNGQLLIGNSTTSKYVLNTLTAGTNISISNTPGAITISSTDTNYYPTTFTWTAGTTAGPTGSLTGTGMADVSFLAFPSASTSASGIVTTGFQSFGGNKWFNNKLYITEMFGFYNGTNSLMFTPPASFSANYTVAMRPVSGTLALLEDLVNTTYEISAVDGADAYSEKIRLSGSNATTDDVILAVGTTDTVYGLTIDRATDTITFSHGNTSTLSGVQGTAGISSITLDGMGHVTAVSTATYLTSQSTDFKTLTVSDTDSGYTWTTTGSIVAAVVGATATFVDGAGIDIDADATNKAIRISHTDTSSVTDLTAVANTFISAQTYDNYGHVLTRTTSAVDFTVAANYAFQNFAIGADSGYTWGTINTNTTQAAESSSDTLTLVVGTGISLFTNTVAGTDAIKIQHADTSSQTSVNNSGRTYIQDITLDEFGHITGLVSATETVTDTDTHWTANLYVGATGTAANGATTNTNTYIKFYENSVARNAFNIKGTGATTVVSDANGHITIDSTNTNTTYTHKVSSQTGGAGIDLDAGGSGSGTDTVTIKGVTGITVTPTDANIITISGHVQHTDTGTTNASFAIDSDGGTSGVLLKAASGEMQFRNIADNAYANIRVNNLYVEGTQTTINSNEVNIGDSILLLNSDITASAQNSNGGLAVKRLMADNITRKDAVIEYNVSTNRWQTTMGDVTGALVTAEIANKKVFTIGDGTLTSFNLDHYLNTKDITVMIRETEDDWEVVWADIRMPTTNRATLTFAVAPALNQYTVTIIG